MVCMLHSTKLEPSGAATTFLSTKVTVSQVTMTTQYYEATTKHKTVAKRMREGKEGGDLSRVALYSCSHYVCM